MSSDDGYAAGYQAGRRDERAPAATLRSRLEVLLVSLRGPEPGGHGGRRGELLAQRKVAVRDSRLRAIAWLDGQLTELGHITGELAALLKQTEGDGG